MCAHARARVRVCVRGVRFGGRLLVNEHGLIESCKVEQFLCCVVRFKFFIVSVALSGLKFLIFL